MSVTIEQPSTRVLRKKTLYRGKRPFRDGKSQESSMKNSLLTIASEWKVCIREKFAYAPDFFADRIDRGCCQTRERHAALYRAMRHTYAHRPHGATGNAPARHHRDPVCARARARADDTERRGWQARSPARSSRERKKVARRNRNDRFQSCGFRAAALLAGSYCTFVLGRCDRRGSARVAAFSRLFLNRRSMLVATAFRFRSLVGE